MAKSKEMVKVVEEAQVEAIEMYPQKSGNLTIGMAKESLWKFST